MIKTALPVFCASCGRELASGEPVVRVQYGPLYYVKHAGVAGATAKRDDYFCQRCHGSGNVAIRQAPHGARPFIPECGGDLEACPHLHGEAGECSSFRECVKEWIKRAGEEPALNLERITLIKEMFNNG